MKTIPIDGVIGVDVTSAALRGALDGAGDVELHIASAGGSVFEALAIHNLLEAHRRAGNHVSARVDGLCASAATYIACAAEQIEVPANGVWMVHSPSAFVIGDARAMTETADHLRAVETLMVDAYARRTGRPPEAIANEVANETYLFGQQIVDAGYADQMIAPLERLPDSQAQALAFARGALADAQAKLRRTGEQFEPERLAALLGPRGAHAPRPAASAPQTGPADTGAEAERKRITAILAAIEASDPRTQTALELIADPHISAESAARILARLPAPGAPSDRPRGPSEFEKHMAALGNPPISPDADASREPAMVDWADAFKY
jgi:ATP-dependent protease ClpP protease subunit